MQETLTLLNSHASVRKFSEKEITEEDEMTIVSTSQRSGTSSNRQAYSIIGIRDKAKKETLSKLTGGQQHVVDSSLFLVFCADLHRLEQINIQKDYETHSDYTEMFIIATVDTALVAERAMITAQALKLGGVMVGGIRNEPDKVSELLNLPNLVYPVMGMSLGYPLEEPKLKPRLDIKAIYHKEEYSDSNIENLIAAYDTQIDAVGYLHNRVQLAERYPNFDGNYSWSEHTARRHAEIIRPHMKSFLNSKGFMRK